MKHEHFGMQVLVIVAVVAIVSVVVIVQRQAGAGLGPGIYCDDSDGGIAPFVPGVVRTAQGQWRDVCRSTMMLRENYCRPNGGAAKTDVRCDNGCSNGACIVPTPPSNTTPPTPPVPPNATNPPLNNSNTTNSTPPPVLCTENDAGMDVFSQGTTTFGSQSYADTCNQATSLTEYYCASGLNTATVSCNCYNGACRPTSCTDSDTGNNPGVAGTTYGNIGGTNFSRADWCWSNTTLLEWYCADPSSAYANFLRNASVSCANTCVNGACV